jgi:hypothetical protein
MPKKRIGIFGDSFSDPTWNNNVYLSWTELLAEDYEVTNFSKNGSSLWYSYQKLKTHRSKFDICIIVATIYGRFYLESSDTHLNINRNTWPVKHNVNLGKLYYEEFFSLEREKTFHDFMIQDILHLDHTIFIPAFEECVTTPSSISLNHYSNAELHHYGVFAYQGPDDRKCHLSRENNLVIFKKIQNAMDNNISSIDISMDEFVVPTEPFNFYFNRNL